MTVQQAIGDAALADPELSVIISADGDGAGLVALVDSYIAALHGLDRSYEMLLIYQDAHAGMRAAIAELKDRPGLKLLAPRPWRGLDAALIQGIRLGTGRVFVTLPAWREIAPTDIDKLVEAATGADTDMATGQRQDLELSSVQKARIAMSHRVLRVLFGENLTDIFCRSRAGRREVFQKVAELGVRQHFLPLVAAFEGYRVAAVPVSPAQDAVPPALHRLNAGSHVSALFDMISLYVALKFLKRPLRFFGAIGLPLMAAGALITLWLVVSRLVFGTPLADRPALVFSVLTFVLGVQIMAMGLVGEIIIFASSRRMRSYEIEKILRGRPPE